MKRSSRSFQIALSALACAVAAGALTLGSYVHFLFAAGYLIAVFAIMVPLAKDFYWGASLCFAGAALLAFLFCGFAIFELLPFIAFFGLHPIVNRLQLRFVKRKPFHALWFIAKAAWFDGALLLMWFTLGGILGFTSQTWYPYIASNLYLVVFLGGTVAFLVYDILIFLCQRSVDAIIRRIGR